MSMVAFQHTPVLMPHVLAGLAPRPHGRYLDATLGGAGHAQAVLAAAQPGGFLLGIDADEAALAAAQAALTAAGFRPSSFATRQSNFVYLAEIAATFGPFDGILLDLGVSSYQLDAPERGFAFRHDGPLDMRLDQSRGPTAADLVAELPEAELANIIFQYGEERQSRRIARRIVERRARTPFVRTADLAEVVAGAVGGPRGKIHPATRTFQALRIAVNRELEHLEAVLPQAVGLLAPGGRLAVISFHSLEDRIVKRFFRAESGYGGSEHDGRPIRLRLLTRRPQEADEAEIAQNPRARSAKLRVAERIADGE